MGWECRGGHTASSLNTLHCTGVLFSLAFSLADTEDEAPEAADVVSRVQAEAVAETRDVRLSPLGSLPRRRQEAVEGDVEHARDVREDVENDALAGVFHVAYRGAGQRRAEGCPELGLAESECRAVVADAVRDEGVDVLGVSHGPGR